MSFSKLAKVASVSVLSFGLVAVPFSISASAQETTNPVEDTVESTQAAVENTDFDWGLLGLLGLIGLAGLAGRGRRDDVRDVDTRYRNEHRTDADPSYQPGAPTNTRTDVPRYRDPNAINRTDYRE
ncbi:WGxxGxxG family protein [Thermocoleostomius sinensis]|jgi:MYXO-CTERM domain-containing protein|uniref:WGxxGxxG-CTERM domain-containing protein n=1 Tax=Thermocoleostomius sinensis A174 TaxID=2016057 RepID=A0A9E8Z9H5_9CYAN|nr:WGxxGxxG family protein [Thermocoleostomius sinensis]WAL59005.1 WGxxGxxG-CTERM domain-containing protein [Thermocoleostomius sinensis A174]